MCNKQFWLEHYPAGHNQQSVVSLVYFLPEKNYEMELSGLEDILQTSFNQSPNNKKRNLAF